MTPAEEIINYEEDEMISEKDGVSFRSREPKPINKEEKLPSEIIREKATHLQYDSNLNSYWETSNANLIEEILKFLDEKYGK